MDQQETTQAMLCLGHCDINHIEICTLLVTKSVLLVGHNHINLTDMFTSAHH